MEQLSLLGVLVDYRVDDQVMEDFWRDYFARELHGGDGLDGGADRDDTTDNIGKGENDEMIRRVVDQGLSTGEILSGSMLEIEATLQVIYQLMCPSVVDLLLHICPHYYAPQYILCRYCKLYTVLSEYVALIRKYFKSMTNFARNLELFLTTTKGYESHADVVLAKRDKSIARREQQYRLRPYFDEAIVANDDDAEGVSVSGDEEHDEVLAQSLRASIREPATVSLSGLLTMFRRRADMDDSGLYFLCDLTERAGLADAIEDVQMSFKTRYFFCMAPVDVDNPDVLKKFRKYATEYSQKGQVSLRDSVSGRHVPQTPFELLELETLHRVSTFPSPIVKYYNIMILIIILNVIKVK
jgi:hypothetical protein